MCVSIRHLKSSIFLTQYFFKVEKKTVLHYKILETLNFPLMRGSTLIRAHHIAPLQEATFSVRATGREPSGPVWYTTSGGSLCHGKSLIKNLKI